MKTILTVACSLIVLSGFCQTGSFQGILIKSYQGERWNSTAVAIFYQTPGKDSIAWQLQRTERTDASGQLVLYNLPVGNYYLSVNTDSITFNSPVFSVQSNQVLVSDLFVTASGENTLFKSSAVTYVAEPGTPLKNPPLKTVISLTDLENTPVQDGMLEEFIVCAYRMPLVSRNGITSSTISRSNFSKHELNTQNNFFQIGSSVISEGNLATGQIRGSRENTVSYYLDGVRINSHRQNQSALAEITIYTGGIPACYGDCTGGVVSMQSRSSEMKGYSDVPAYHRPAFSIDRFSPIYENVFLSPSHHPHSTFGLDVNKASWTYCKRILEKGGTLTRDAVKTEEFINSFRHRDIQVSDEKIVRIETEHLVCPWNKDHELVAIHVKTAAMEEKIDSMSHRFVFLIDVSGSMLGRDRLELVKKGMLKLVDVMDENDQIAIVTYSGSEAVALYPTHGDDKAAIKNAINRLEAGGSTNGIGGLKMAYQLAEEQFDPHGNNRIILATDGDFNVGISSPDSLKQFISAHRGKGIYLTALGVGMGNYRNDILESLANYGDGNHYYLQNAADAEGVLIKDIGNLITLATDAKLDVQFNPHCVKTYRLLGYENRLMPSEDFDDDTKDGGELGVDQQVVALYEIELGVDSSTAMENSDSVIYRADDLMAVRMRYKVFTSKTSEQQIAYVESGMPFTENPTLVVTAAMALELRDSPFKGICSARLIKQLLKKVDRKKAREIIQFGSLLLKATANRKAYRRW